MAVKALAAGAILGGIGVYALMKKLADAQLKNAIKELNTKADGHHSKLVEIERAQSELLAAIKTLEENAPGNSLTLEDIKALMSPYETAA